MMPSGLAQHIDILAVLTIHLSAIGITLLDIELSLKITSLLVAIGYTLYKWYKLWKVKQ